ncbi:DinB family protein [Oceanobacillus sp. E9]|uniref:DinB family protein n=1 Tax=Oceanobacillus sp. E9 TaxID=1742575 RepID=UPI001F0B000E|nr:DinB family protein [Oceanobacillus sp. E9]
MLINRVKGSNFRPLTNANDPSRYNISFIEATDGINEKEAFWKPDTNSHSVAEIVQHLIY